MPGRDDPEGTETRSDAEQRRRMNDWAHDLIGTPQDKRGGTDDPEGTESGPWDGASDSRGEGS